MKQFFLRRWLPVISSLLLLTLGSVTQAQVTQAQFTQGNLVIYRVGDDGAVLGSSATPVFLDEYSPTGTLIQSVALPTTVNGNNRRLTAGGTATSEGLLTRSTDGQYVLLTGYDAASGTASVAGTASAATNRTVARVAANGAIDVSTALNDFSTGSNPRSAVSTNGNDIWVTGGVGGVRYTTLGSITSTQLSTSSTNLRQVNIFNGQLYASTGAGSIRIGTVGTGTPTTAGQVITNIPGFPTTGSPYAFFFADLNTSVAGVDVLYVADDAAGLLKYSLVNGNWTSNGTIVTGAYRGLTASVTGTSVTLYATTGTTLVSLTDATGYNGPFTGTPTTMATAEPIQSSGE